MNIATSLNDLIGLMKTQHLHKNIKKYVIQISDQICEIVCYT